ncbi:hypothetical protein NUW54_g14735 [Trametes sanguinea]|uniref:Uncharacterized protein n=1 Tax=Trametes sanguinea TaxID=158606 RepID=A0ACC1MAG5_9APHY|nr:hypothetical protein NUW54_g14735 [Trametes sanguinea]
MTVDPVSLPVPVSATATSLTDPKPPPTPDTLPTRLPVPSVVSRMKPKQTAPPKKPRAPRSVKQTGPATVRMTRSVSLRQKKVEEEAKQRANPQPGPSATPHRRRSQSFSSYAQPTAASAAKASPVKPVSSRPSSGAPFQFTFTPSAAATLFERATALASEWSAADLDRNEFYGRFVAVDGLIDRFSASLSSYQSFQQC